MSKYNRALKLVGKAFVHEFFGKDCSHNPIYKPYALVKGIDWNKCINGSYSSNFGEKKTLLCWEVYRWDPILKEWYSPASLNRFKYLAVPCRLSRFKVIPDPMYDNLKD